MMPCQRQKKPIGTSFPTILSFKISWRRKPVLSSPPRFFFIVYYFALPILVGYAPKFMSRPVLGPLNIAYLFALSQFFMAWIIALLYMRAAASANLPVIIFSIFWKRFTTEGAIWGLATGLFSSLFLIVISPSIMGVDGPSVAAAARHLIQSPPWFPLENPGIVSIPLGFVGAFVGTMMSRVDDAAEAKFTELGVRANTGLGSEQATAH
jgi:cation/acetate symporter